MSSYWSLKEHERVRTAVIVKIEETLEGSSDRRGCRPISLSQLCNRNDQFLIDVPVTREHELVLPALKSALTRVSMSEHNG